MQITSRISPAPVASSGGPWFSLSSFQTSSSLLHQPLYVPKTRVPLQSSYCNSLRCALIKVHRIANDDVNAHAQYFFAPLGLNPALHKISEGGASDE